MCDYGLMSPAGLRRKTVRAARNLGTVCLYHWIVSAGLCRIVWEANEGDRLVLLWMPT